MVEREIEIEAPVQDVWEAVVSEDGRQAWLDDDRPVHVESVQAPHRLVWWWAGDEEWTRVELTLVPAVSSTRVVVRETVPSFPLTALARAWAVVGRGHPALARHGSVSA